MSKIFQALHGAQNEVSELLPELIGEGIVETEPAANAAAAPEKIHPAAPAEEAISRENFAPSEALAAPPAAGIRVVPLALAAASPLLPFENPHAHAAEQYRILRTKLAHHPKRPKMIVVSSANPGDGKTFTAINLAGVLSLKGDAKVLLLDADFRRSAIHKQLGLAEGPGLSEALLGHCALEQAVVQAEQFPNLHVLVNGKLENMNPSELLDSPYWRALCQAARKRYQYVILDSPPVAAVADYELIQMAADGTVLVVRPEHTNRSACFKAIETIPREKFLGVILNCAEPWFLHKTYTYEYGYGYGYASSEAGPAK
ncbi:MAG TPA: CpsD/CapB family tyrosine-protein kinase [Bryobacteraceae bacterium]|nr:CpsD/CapB family tyrosine-protein kinase [Bryobacteraceae bacterium]